MHLVDVCLPVKLRQVYSQLLPAAGCVSNSPVQQLNSTFPVCFIDTVTEQHGVDGCSELQVPLVC